MLATIDFFFFFFWPQHTTPSLVKLHYNECWSINIDFSKTLHTFLSILFETLKQNLMAFVAILKTVSVKIIVHHIFHQK